MGTTKAEPLSDLQSPKDLRVAIAALDTSTCAIDNHIEAAREVLERTTSTSHSAKPRPSIQQHQLSKLIDTLRENIQHGHRTSSENLSRAIASSLITIDDILSRHDHNFQVLEKQQIAQSTSHSSQQYAGRVPKLLLALQQTRSDVIRTRLNRLYLEALRAQSLDVNSYNEDFDTLASTNVELVKADLKALHAEINDVSQMLVSHEHGDSLTAINSSLDESETALKQQQTQKAAEQIANMAVETEILTERAEMLHSHRIVLQRLAIHLKDLSSPQTSPQLHTTSTTQDAVPRKGMASLAALHQYLGLSHASIGRMMRSEQIDSGFDDLTSLVSTSLAIQAEQESHMRSPAPSFNITSNKNHATGEVAYASSLNDLDDEIAAVKAQMDALPS